jgi:ketosteroid isomerase-like protein
MRSVLFVFIATVATPAVAVAGEPEPRERLSGPVAEIVAAERAFAKRCGEVGIRASFLEYFAADGVSFAPDPGNARERLEKRPVPKTLPPVSLVWGPEQAEAAPAGDLGWSTGPTAFTDKTGKNPPHYGYYFSVWRKQPDGAWKVVIDVGVDSPSERAIPTVAEAVAATAVPGKEQGPEVIKREDEAFCRRSSGEGAGKAYAAALAANARVHRDGMLPVVGEKAWRPWANELAGVMTCSNGGAFSSKGPGFGYTFGSWERRATPGGAVLDKGFYTRVWRHEKAGWRIAVDVGTLVTP